MTIHEAQQQLLFQLYHIYDDHEAAAIANLVMENITEWKKIDRILNKNVPLSLPKLAILKKYTDELLTHKPVQYVLHESWFCGMKFYVDENVLIPRPETEELVNWIDEEVRNENLEVTSKKEDSRNNEQDSSFTILDVGTGSGCIAVALKKKLHYAKVNSCDVSEKALNIAKQNALSNNADVDFLHLDFLDQQQTKELSSYNIIVSNPPYIPLNDKKTMSANIVNFEPHIALFVSNDEPLVFYHAIADFGLKKLFPGGKIFVEVHEDLSADVKKLFLAKGFNEVTIKKDIHGKERMLKATMLL
jgi:release factor glutamine methyltransferase